VSLTAKDVAEILRLLEESRFDELTLEMNGVKVQLRRGQAVTQAQGAAPSADAARALPKSAQAASLPASKPALAAPPGGVAVPAPLLGIFYRAPKPGEPPFVEVGTKVSPDTVIGIIEVMKLMNTVRAGVSGEVLRIDAVNGELVEFGEALLFVKG
jgi:acetyl-CoA carboxylase biotin carboxyl carrier protein